MKRETEGRWALFDPSIPGRTPPSKGVYRYVLALCAVAYTVLMVVAVGGAWRWAQIMAAVMNALVVLMTLWLVGFVNRIRGAQSE